MYFENGKVLHKVKAYLYLLRYSFAINSNGCIQFHCMLALMVKTDT